MPESLHMLHILKDQKHPIACPPMTCSFLLGFGMMAWLAAPHCLSEPLPTFQIDFDGASSTLDAHVLEDQPQRTSLSPLIPTVMKPVPGGIAASNCLDFSSVTRKRGDFASPQYSSTSLTRQLRQVRSFTVTGWMFFAHDPADREHDWILSCPGKFELFKHGFYTGRLILDLRLEGGHRKVVGSSWMSHYFAPARWVFFAVTFDGNSTGRNVAFFAGSETTPVELDVRQQAGKGSLSLSAFRSLIVGAWGKGNQPFHGKLDSIRLYADAASGRAALSLEQLERIRREDLGPEWLRRVAEEKNDRIRHEKAAQADLERKFYSDTLNAYQVELYERHFPDRAAAPLSQPEPRSVPRGARLPLAFALHAAAPAHCEIALGPFHHASGKGARFQSILYEALPVPVEANNNGAMNTAVGRKPPGLWSFYQVRVAPFETHEALVPRSAIHLAPNRFSLVVADVSIPRNAEPGTYSSHLIARTAQQQLSVPISFHVDATVAPSQALNVIHWLDPNPAHLSLVPGPEWWSERHWTLLEKAGRLLREFGDTAMFTPVLGDHPLVQVTRARDGAYRFDFSRFDRWAELFLGLGFRELDGRHVTSWSPTPVLDEATGKTIKPFKAFGTDAATIRFIEAFYRALYRHLQEKRWTDLYVQCQYDEPKDVERYKTLTSLLREFMPGIPNKDAINSPPERFSRMIDVYVFAISTMEMAGNAVDERRARHQVSWLYHCASPYPPYPNRHLDDPLVQSRLYPWLAFYLGAEGYLFWAANRYRGADPYQTSVGPLPHSKLPPGYVGHPPGDNWMLYPGKNGLVPSLRALAFREGILDHALLTELAGRDPTKAEAIVKGIVRNLVDFERSPLPYQRARRILLEALDR